MTAPSGWPPTVPPAAPDAGLLPFDASRPNIARAYDYLLGGKDNFAADRVTWPSRPGDLAEKILAIYPGAGQMARENRRSLLRALNYVLSHGTPSTWTWGPGAHQPGRA